MENKELGRLVLKQAEAFPESFDIRTYGRSSSCGTVACIGGHAMLLSGYTLDYNYIRPDGTLVVNEALEARMLLGLSDEEFHPPGEPHCLFYGLQDPQHALARLRALCEDD